MQFIRNDFLVSTDDKGQVRFWQKSDKVRPLFLISMASLMSSMLVEKYDRCTRALSTNLCSFWVWRSSVKIWTIVDGEDTCTQTCPLDPREDSDWIASQSGRDCIGHLPSRQVPAGARRHNTSSFPRSVESPWNQIPHEIHFILGSHYPRHLQNRQKCTMIFGRVPTTTCVRIPCHRFSFSSLVPS